MVNVFNALNEGTKFLKDRHSETPRLDAEVIMSSVLGWNRLKLITERNYILSDEIYRNYFNLINKRAAGMPVAYITGHKEFMGMDFIIEEGVLVPRADTEIVVEKVIEECACRKSHVDIVDVGCGSGAIAVSIAVLIKMSNVTAIDISNIAVNLTKKNAALNNVDNSVRVIKGNLLLSVLQEKFDVVVSNPPYIETSVIGSLQRDVKDYEPLLALDGGKDGLDFYRKITCQAKKCLKDEGMLVYEIGSCQAESVGEIMDCCGFKDIKVYKDLAGLDRCVCGKI